MPIWITCSVIWMSAAKNVRAAVWIIVCWILPSRWTRRWLPICCAERGWPDGIPDSSFPAGSAGCRYSGRDPSDTARESAKGDVRHLALYEADHQKTDPVPADTAVVVAAVARGADLSAGAGVCAPAVLPGQYGATD